MAPVNCKSVAGNIAFVDSLYFPFESLFVVFSASMLLAGPEPTEALGVFVESRAALLFTSLFQVLISLGLFSFLASFVLYYRRDFR